MENTIQHTYKIPSYRLQGLLNKIDKINRRAKKNGLQGVIINQSEELSETWKDENDNHRVLHYRNVEIIGSTPKIAGWTFLGAIQHLEKGVNLIRTLPGVEKIPEEYRSIDPKCEHCKVNRIRLNTFLLLNDDGSYKQVGRNCLQDFLGGVDPQLIAKLAEQLLTINDLASSDEEDFYGRGGSFVAYPIDEFLQFTCAAIDEFGWVSRTEAKQSLTPKCSTADRVVLALTTREDNEKLTITETNIEIAKKALDYIREDFDKENLNDYEYNLKTVCNREVLTIKELGICASLIPFYYRHIQKKIEQGKQALSSYVGQKGEKLVVKATLTREHKIENNYGVTTIYSFLSEDNNVFVWFSSADKYLELDKQYQVVGKVKNHNDYNGIKQTILTRCKVDEIQLTV